MASYYLHVMLLITSTNWFKNLKSLVAYSDHTNKNACLETHIRHSWIILTHLDGKQLQMLHKDAMQSSVNHNNMKIYTGSIRTNTSSKAMDIVQ